MTIPYADPAARRGITIRRSATVVRIDVPPQDAASIRRRHRTSGWPLTAWQWLTRLEPARGAIGRDETRHLAVVRLSDRRLTFAAVYGRWDVRGWSVPRSDMLELRANRFGPGLLLRCRSGSWGMPFSAELLSDLPAEVTAWMADQLAPYGARPAAAAVPRVTFGRRQRSPVGRLPLAVARRRGVAGVGLSCTG